MNKGKFEVNNKIILGIAAHPDDLDFGASASVAKWIKEGAEVYYLILTDGTRGSEDLTISAEQLKEMRHQEQINAGKVLGLKEVFFLDYPDGRLTNSEDVQREVVKIIRKVKPHIVITTDPTLVYDENTGFINHPDHRNAGQIALDCVFPFARNSRSFPELLEEGHEIHVVETVLLANMFHQNFYVDVTETLELKLKALKEHASQYSSYEAIVERMTQRAELFGKELGTKYAEGFVILTTQPHG